jgi:hypothetical protein
VAAEGREGPRRSGGPAVSDRPPTPRDGGAESSAPRHHPLWERYLAAEARGDRRAALPALAAWVDALRAGPDDERRAWVVDFCRRALDAGEPMPIRHPLLVGLLVPFLRAELDRREFPAARWLASLAQQLYAHRALWSSLGFVTERQLLERALAHDPDDRAAQRRLLRVMCGELDYATHELPWGVLDGVDGASPEGCTLLLADVARLAALARDLREPAERLAQIDRWRQQIEAWREHLTAPSEASYRDLLEKRGLL